MMHALIRPVSLRQSLRSFLRVAGLVVLFVTAPLTSHAAIVAAGFHSGRIEMFDEQTNAQSTLATLTGAQLSGIVYNPLNDSLYVSALNQGGVYTLNARTGAITNFSFLGVGPGGLAVSSTGNIYVSNFGANELRVYDSSLSNLLSTITLPAPSSGVGFAANGDVLIATPGAGVFRFDGVNLQPFINNPAAAAQITVDSQGDIYIGHGLGFSNAAFKYDNSGNLITAINVPNSLVSSLDAGSSSATSPSGIAIDSNGNLIVSVLGRSSPGDTDINGTVIGERGGILRFDSTGNYLSTIAMDSFAFSGVVIVPAAIPEPTSMSVFGLMALSVLRLRRRK